MTRYLAPRLRPPHAHTRSLFAALAMVLAAAAALLSTGSAAVSPAASPPRFPSRGGPNAAVLGARAVSPDLARLASASPRRPVQVIVQLRHNVDPLKGAALIRSLGGEAGPYVHIINGLSARMAAGDARRLAASPLVRVVSLNAPIQESTLVNFKPYRMATVFNQAVGATNLWNHSTGKGVGVAVIDTGITGDTAAIPDFSTSQTSGTSRAVVSAVIDPNATTSADTYGHGTDVAGLIAGDGGYRDSSDPLWGKYAGSAPDANLISIKISDDSNQATTLDAIYGLQFAVDHKADYNIRVVNMSFRSTSAQSYQTDPLDAAAEQAWFDGIVVVAAAGNLGTQSDAVSYAPGNDPYVVTVGATDDQGTRSTADDAQASWSSQGTTQDGITKPDLLAPGAHIVSTFAPNSAFASLCPTCVVGGAYFRASGTSMAAPIVSGAVADLLAAHPDWTPDMVKSAIVSTARELAGGGSELQAQVAYGAAGSQVSGANQGLTPNQLIDPGTGTIDQSQAGWDAASWSTATSPLAASWSAASWSCDSCSSTDTGTVASTAASWSLSWATMWG